MKKLDSSFWLRWAVRLSAFITLGLLFVLIGYILVMGVSHLNLNLFSWTYNTTNLSMMPAIINTLLMILLVLCIACPIGIFSAIYLVEYAKKGSRYVKWVRLTAETLSGIPSIVYGLFGYLMFNIFLKMGYSFLSGALTLSLMVLPMIMRTSEEALKSVPDMYREASYGLGAGKLRTIFKVVLPSCMSGILSGVILSIGRIVGETAALIYTCATAPKIFEGLFGSGRTLAVHMYALLNEGLYMDEAYATAVILMILVLFINLLSKYVGNKLAGGKNEK